MRKEDDFSNLFSPVGQDFQERKDKINERRLKKVEFDEQYYFKNKPDWLLDLYKKIDDYCLNGIKRGVERTCLKTYIRWTYRGTMFCRIFVFQDNLKLYLRLKYSELENLPVFIRDYSERVRGIPTIEILLGEEYLQNEEAFFLIVSSLIEKAFLEVTGAKKRLIAKRVTEPTKPLKASSPSSLNLSVDDNGYVSINLRIHKSQKEILNKILQETILK
ncbi:hypothetical protein ES695_02770 [Candidatus Atribacteria bacterium 1244-E10-H5-B2]|nr:MAG: hypothetical protein ES695_02770 [Candidatus Atribacteria bacterium 1244-E10-H5-B2]